MRFSRLFVPILAVMFVASACGGSGGGVEAGLRPLVLSAVQTSTESEGTAKASFVVRMNMTGIPGEPDESFEMRAEGAVDIVNERGQFTVELPEGGDAEMPFSGTVEMVVDGDTAYIRLPDATGDPAKPWLRVSGEGSDLSGGMPFGDIGSSFDPRLGLDMLGLGEPTNVETVGREELRGASTVHYRVTTQPSQADVEDADAFMQMFAGGEPLVYDVWVDDDDRLRKMTFSIDLAAMLQGFFEAFGEMATGGGEGSEEEFPTEMSMLMEMETEVWDFGKPVDIQVPPADQVTDAPPGFGS